MAINHPIVETQQLQAVANAVPPFNSSTKIEWSRMNLRTRRAIFAQLRKTDKSMKTAYQDVNRVRAAAQASLNS